MLDAPSTSRAGFGRLGAIDAMTPAIALPDHVQEKEFLLASARGS